MSVKICKEGKLKTICGELYSSGNFPGQITMGANKEAPAGWLLCDGTAYNKNDYTELYAVIGDTYNKPDVEEGKFNVPDFKGSHVLANGIALNYFIKY